MSNTNDHGELHLVRVEVVELVLCADPFRVETDRINTALNLLCLLFMFSVAIARTENIQRNRKELIIDPSAVKSKSSHH